MSLSPSAKLLLSKHPEEIREIVFSYSPLVMSAIEKYSDDELWTDFVQKHTEPKRDTDFIIMSASDGKENWVYRENEGGYLSSKNSFCWHLHLTNGQKITAIKRLPGGDVFAVDETVETNNGRGNHKISGFEIIDGRLCVQMKDFPTEFEFVELVKKSKPVLFKTEDGKPVYEGDAYYTVTDDFIILRTDVASKDDIKNGKLRSFSTGEKADEYVLLNKPCLSVNDIKSFSTATVYSIVGEAMKELVKQKSTHA